MTSHVFCIVCDDDDNAHMFLLKITHFNWSPRVGVMASLHNVVLASFVAQVMFYNLSVSGAGWGNTHVQLCLKLCRNVVVSLVSRQSLDAPGVSMSGHSDVSSRFCI